MIQIAVESQFKNYSHYNLIVMCGGFNEEGEKLYVRSVHKSDEQSRTLLEVATAHHIETILYFIPRSLPTGKNIAIVDHPPFEARVEVESNGESLYSKTHMINGWGGSTIKFNLEI